MLMPCSFYFVVVVDFIVFPFLLNEERTRKKKIEQKQSEGKAHAGAVVAAAINARAGSQLYAFSKY